MTYREALKGCLDNVQIEEMEFDNPFTGEHVHQDANEIFPIAFGFFVRNMSFILVQIADILITTDFPTVTMGGEVIEGKATDPKDVTLIHYLRVLSGLDLLRSTNLNTQLSNFLKWLMDREIDTDEERLEKLWYDTDVLNSLWNDYAIISNGDTGGFYEED